MTSVSLQKCTPTSRRTICTLIRHILTAVHRHPQHQLPMASALTSALKTQTLGERIPVRKWTRMGDSGGMRPLLHRRLPPGAWSLCVLCHPHLPVFPRCLSLSADPRSKRLVMCLFSVSGPSWAFAGKLCVYPPAHCRQAGGWVLGASLWGGTPQAEWAQVWLCNSPRIRWS